MILRPLKPRRKKKEIAHHTSIFKIVPITTMILHGCFIRQRGRRPRAQRFRISSWPLAKGAQGSRDAHASPHHALHSLLGAKVAPCLGTWEKPQMGVCLVSNDIIVFRNSYSQDHWARRRGAKPVKIQGILVGWRPKALLIKSLHLLEGSQNFLHFLSIMSLLSLIIILRITVLFV